MQGPAVTVKWRQTGQGSNLFAIKRAQLGQVGEQSTRKNLANTRHGTQQLVALTPQGSIANQLAELMVEAGKSLFQPTDLLIDATVQNFWGAGPAILLCGQHLDQLAPPSNQCFERLRLLIR